MKSLCQICLSKRACSFRVGCYSNACQTEDKMVFITEDLVRRRSEHNNCEIFSLEEVSLHQQDIEKIEHIGRWCKELKILYLQNNLIPRIENVHRLKKLEYLNLALNNIELVENLEGCESLQKLDLTVNFVGRLSSVESLKHNVHLRELFLVGNPCTEFQGYRQYVVATLPQLKYLDGKEIGRSERIRAGQGLEEVRRLIKQQEQEYLRRRASERQEVQREGSEVAQHELKKDRSSPAKLKMPGSDGHVSTDIHNTTPVPENNKGDQGREVEMEDKKRCLSLEDQEREFWETPCAFTPESRLEAHQHLKQNEKAKARETEKTPKAQRTLITPQGKVMNVNEPKLDFCLTEDENNNTVILDLEVYRHMDTSLMDVDVQPTYARVTVKGKVFQLVLPAEVRPDSSTAKRSQTTGHLVLTMPKAQGEIKATKTNPAAKASESSNTPEKKTRDCNSEERLEVDPRKRSMVDLSNIVPRDKSSGEGPLEMSKTRPSTTNQQTHFIDNFVDDPDVPPLIRAAYLVTNGECMQEEHLTRPVKYDAVCHFNDPITMRQETKTTHRRLDSRRSNRDMKLELLAQLPRISTSQSRIKAGRREDTVQAGALYGHVECWPRHQSVAGLDWLLPTGFGE
ncbi:hypothetical protein DPEC_G00057740 [Dallia pectoralis]|uniref:Uncharacterized protein n=1 Tax=Dallia pectoralis TaxID=75939 RepID=A0ACC2H5Y0_DALPE|nr:hypothetical protein DPEC_G00057740 [Dallia pectoralis]